MMKKYCWCQDTEVQIIDGECTYEPIVEGEKQTCLFKNLNSCPVKSED
jgi:hypothetical protein